MGVQFDRAFNHRAYLHNYKSVSLFDDEMSEFVNSRQILRDLVDEYKLAETEEYIHTHRDGGEMDV